MGQLAGSVESQLEAVARREDRIGAAIARTAEEQLRLLDERIRSAFEARAKGLAELIRSDSIALREELAVRPPSP